MTSFERDIAAQLRHLTKTATMWGSPEELEAVAQHFTHVWLSAQTPGWRFEETFALWQTGVKNSYVDIIIILYILFC